MTASRGPSALPASVDDRPPLVDYEPTSPISRALPSTWCVVVCEQGCQESWTVDVADFEPRLTAADVERMLTPLLLTHEEEHRG